MKKIVRKQLPNITIATDAGYSIKKNFGVWACYIRADGKKVMTGGLLKEPVTDSTMAERMAIANALFIADRLVDLTKHRLIIYADNLAALGIASPKKFTPASKHYHIRLAKAQWFKKNIQPYLDKAKACETRHVKSHLPRHEWDKNSKRNYMNHWCDAEVRRIKRVELSRLEKEALQKSTNEIK